MVEFLLNHDADRNVKDTKVGSTAAGGRNTAAIKISRHVSLSHDVRLCFIVADEPNP